MVGVVTSPDLSDTLRKRASSCKTTDRAFIRATLAKSYARRAASDEEEARDGIHE